MGADGHIQIYDWQKVEDKYDEETIESFLGHLGSPVMYLQVLQGKKYLTRYWGDNLGTTDLYEVVKDAYLVETDAFKKNWYSGYEVDYFMKLEKDTRKFFWEFVQFLEKECSLTSWEVWT